MVDELDDVGGTLGLLWIGARRGFALSLLGLAGAAGLLAVSVLGLAPLLICGAAVALSAALAFTVKLAGGHGHA